LGELSDYKYLSTSGCYDVDGLDDTKEFNETRHAMKAVGMKGKQVEAVLQIIAAVLHIGSVDFAAAEIDNAEGSKLKNKDGLKRACRLLGMSAEKLAKTLTFRQLQTMAAGGKIDSFEVPLNPTQAKATRDALSKALYSRLFDFLVQRVNKALDINKQLDAMNVKQEDLLGIGVLDIYGFEIFKKNGFEQFCINYVNEKLQQIFIELTLKAEQEEYEREGIKWTAIPFFNNKVRCGVYSLSPLSCVFFVRSSASSSRPSIHPLACCGCSTMCVRLCIRALGPSRMNHSSTRWHRCTRGTPTGSSEARTLRSSTTQDRSPIIPTASAKPMSTHCLSQ
jgi:myosin-1